MKSFKDLDFGEATTEFIVNDEYFYSHYYDRFDLKNHLKKRDRFLILGPKGSGKSAAGKYCKLLLERENKKPLIYRETTMKALSTDTSKDAKKVQNRKNYPTLEVSEHGNSFSRLNTLA